MEKPKDEEEDNDLTPEQNDALKKAKELLACNFDAYVITVRAADESLDDTVVTDWNGATSDVLGLAHITAMRLTRRATEDDE